MADEIINPLDQKILDDIKKPLGLDTEYDVFDAELKIHIDSVLGDLHQLGVGPRENAFSLATGNETWRDFFESVVRAPNLNAAKTYIYMRVRLIFDPPTTSFAITSFEKQIKELEWRLNVAGDHSSINNQ